MRILLAVTGTLLLTCSSLSAQIPCYAENDGPEFADNVSMGGPDLLLAILLVAPENLTVSGMEVFTGEGSGTNTIGIWSHDAVENQPDMDLSTGSWSMSSSNSWQGADLPTTVSLVAGETYWIMWGPQNESQAAVLPVQPGNGQVYRASFDGGNTWIGPFSGPANHWKYRLFCGAAQGPLFLRGDAA